MRVWSYLGTEALALCSGGVGVGRDGGAGVDVICVDVVADPTAHRAAVVPAGHAHTDTQSRERLTVMLFRQSIFHWQWMGFAVSS